MTTIDPRPVAERYGVRHRPDYVGRFRVEYKAADGETQTLYNPQPKQDVLHACGAPNILYGGQAGGGKSHGLRWDAIIKCLRVPGLKVLFMRREFGELENTHLIELATEVPADLATYVDNKHRLSFTNGSLIQFGHCQHEKDVKKYLSTAWDVIYLDEGSLFTPRQMRMLRTRLRTKNPRVRTVQFIVGTNPGGEGHLFLFQRFIAKAPPKGEERNYNPDEWVFIPSALEDNQYLDASEYEKQFSGLDDAEYAAYRRGDWEAFAGQFFRSWSREKHVIKHTDFELQDWHEVEGGMDWAWSPGMGWVGWAAFDEHGLGVLYKELTFQESTALEVADMIAARCTTEMERRMTIRADSSMWTPQQKEGGVSVAEEINDRLAELGLDVTLVRANKDRALGWLRVKQYLNPKRALPAGGTGPWLRIVDGAPRNAQEDEYEDPRALGCPYLVATIGAQIYDDRKPGDMKKGATDHGCDGTRYLLMAREPIATVPLELRPGVPHHERVHAKRKRIVLTAMKQHNQEMAAGQGVTGSLDDDPGVGIGLEAAFESDYGETSDDVSGLWD